MKTSSELRRYGDIFEANYVPGTAAKVKNWRKREEKSIGYGAVVLRWDRVKDTYIFLDHK